MASVTAPPRNEVGAHRWLRIGAGVLLLLIAGALAFLAAKWPFTRQKVLRELGQQFGGAVQATNFHITYFPTPGCWAENITVQRGGHASGPPLVSAQKATLEDDYPSLLIGRKHIDRLRIDGLRVYLVPGEKTGTQQNGGGSTNKDASSLTIGELTTKGALLEIASKQTGKPPLKFEVHTLKARNIGGSETISYDVKFTNPEPTGEIESAGHIGPLEHNQLEQTPVSGSYKFTHANLGVFAGIAGTLASTGKFGGVLSHMNVTGETEMPDFEVTSAGHRVHLTTRFRAVVNGMNGDTTLVATHVEVEHTAIETDGAITGKDGKTVNLEMTVQHGRIQDLLPLAMKSSPPPMDGSVSFRAKVKVPPENRKFLQKLDVDADVGIDDARFLKPRIQQNVDTLSARAQGDKTDDPSRVISNMRGHIVIRNGVAHLTNVTFRVPGALAQMDGTYNLLNQQLDFDGTLRMEAELSQATRGVKSFFLKALDPFFKKKHAGAVIPIKLTGTYSHPSFGFAIASRHRDDPLRLKK